MGDPNEDVGESDVLRSMRRQQRRNALIVVVPVVLALLAGVAYLVVTAWPSGELGTYELSREWTEADIELDETTPLSFYVEVDLTGDHQSYEGDPAPHAAILEAELWREGERVGTVACAANEFSYCPEQRRYYHEHWQCWLDCELTPRRSGAHSLRLRWQPGREWPPEDVERIAVTPEQR